MVSDLGACLREMDLHDHFFGEMSLTVVLYDRDRQALARAVAAATKVFADHDACLGRRLRRARGFLDAGRGPGAGGGPLSTSARAEQARHGATRPLLAPSSADDTQAYRSPAWEALYQRWRAAGDVGLEAIRPLSAMADPASIRSSTRTYSVACTPSVAVAAMAEHVASHRPTVIEDVSAAADLT
jgi:hypothetical protein